MSDNFTTNNRWHHISLAAFWGHPYYFRQLYDSVQYIGTIFIPTFARKWERLHNTWDKKQKKLGKGQISIFIIAETMN